MSDAWLNFYTNREKFYFEQEVVFNAGISSHNSDSFTINLLSGNLTIMTDAWMNFYTDRSSFYFNKPIYLNLGELSSHSTHDLKLQTNGTTRVFVSNADGNVGIGTTSPDAKLAVKGDIHTQEVLVDLNGAVAPDFVFEPNYKLRTLAETEKYIQENKHLPEIPSAAKMEENGIELKTMNLKLLQKIEELTLYTIEQQKQLRSLQKQVNELKQTKNK